MLSSDNQKLQAELNALKQKMDNNIGDTNTEEKIAALHAEISAKDIRIASLDMQLVQSAQDYTRKISDLKMQIFELEINQSMASSHEMERSSSPDSTLTPTRSESLSRSPSRSKKPTAASGATGNGAKAAKSLQQGRRGSNVYDT